MQQEMAKRRIDDCALEFFVEGLPKHKGVVDVKVFYDQLAKLHAAITHFDALRVQGAKPTIKYGVVGLKHESPATVFIAPIRESDEPLTPNSDFSGFVDVIAQISSARELPDWVDQSFLERIKDLAKPVERSFIVSGIRFEERTVSFSKDMVEAVQYLLTLMLQDETIEGSVKGRIEAMNVHGASNTFRIYPRMGPTKVSCRFPESLKKEALAAMGHLATVYGTLKYKHNAAFPTEIKVREIDVVENPDDLPTLQDLYGVAPELTDDLNAVDLVRQMRNEW